MCVCNTPKCVEYEMVVCVVLNFRCVCEWGLKLGRVYVGRFMVG